MCFVCVQAQANPAEYAGHISTSENEKSASYATDNSLLSSSYSAAGANDYVNGLLFSSGASWGEYYGQAVTINYSFNYSEGGRSDYIYANGASNFSAAEQQAAIGAMAKISAFANVTFVNVTGSGSAQLVFYKGDLTIENAAGVAQFYYDHNAVIFTASVGMDTGYSPNFDTQGTYNYATLLHEIGHALGLKHPHDGSVNIPAPYDHKDYTVMSYNYDNEDAWSNNMPTNFQSIDIAALQLLYGAAGGSTSGGGGEVILGDNNDNYVAVGAAENIKGGLGTDTLIGNAGNDTIYGGRSQADPDDPGDVIRGEGGNDEIYGNGGNDLVYGGNGLDTVWGGRGFDTIYGNDGDDSLAGGGGIAHPEDEADTIYGGAGNDSIIGNGGNDSVYGEGGNDTFYGGYGDDFFQGGDGDDLIIGQFGDDYLYGNAGNDIFYFYNANNYDIIADFTAGDIIRLDSNINNSGITNATQAAAFVGYNQGWAHMDFGDGHAIWIYTSLTLDSSHFQIV